MRAGGIVSSDVVEEQFRAEQRLRARGLSRAEIAGQLGLAVDDVNRVGCTTEGCGEEAVAPTSLCVAHLWPKGAPRDALRRATAGAPRAKPLRVNDRIIPSAAELPSLEELRGELSVLEVELDHVEGELSRLYERQRAANARVAEVIGLMAQHGRAA